jgi:hypothetical protein
LKLMMGKRTENLKGEYKKWLKVYKEINEQYKSSNLK